MSYIWPDQAVPGSIGTIIQPVGHRYSLKNWHQGQDSNLHAFQRRINSAVTYQLADPGVWSRRADLHRSSPVYETGVLLLDDAGMEGASGFAPPNSRFADGRVN